MKTLLLIDDSPFCRKAMRRAAEPLGFSILEADGGQHALELIREQGGADVVLLDWIMPGMDGMEFLQSLRSESLSTRPVVVMCTVENDAPHIQEALRAGADEYIMKPFTEDMVRDKLQAAGVL